MKIRITHIDTACCLIDIDGFFILTDPAFDAPFETTRRFYHHGFGAISRKTSSPGLKPNQLPEIQLVLLSHHQHKDNIDDAGFEITSKAEHIVSTVSASRKIKSCQGLPLWTSTEFAMRDGSILKITATPAQHRPSWLPNFFSGEVIGFVLEHHAFNGPLYISGDTVFFKGMIEVAKRFRPSTALLHVGSAEFRFLTGPGRYTMNRKDYVHAVREMNLKLAIPIHNGGWTHFHEDNDTLNKGLLESPDVSGKTLFLKSGVTTEIEV